MNLMYLRIDDPASLLHNVELVFDKRWKYCFDDGKRVVKLTRDNAVQDEIFSISLKNQKTPVKNLNVIVGANGSGKTSIAALLARLDQSSGYKVVFSVERGDDIECYYAYKHVKSEQQKRNLNYIVEINGKSQNLAIDEECYNAKLANLFSVVYTTPHFTGENIFSNVRDNFFDLSTAGILYPETQPLRVEYLSFNGIQVDYSREWFAFEERRRALEFASRYYSLSVEDRKEVPFPMPMHVHLNLAPEKVYKFRRIFNSWIKEADKGEGSDPILKKILKKLILILDRTPHADFIEKAYCLYLTTRAFDENISQMPNVGESEIAKLVDDWEEGLQADDILHKMAKNSVAAYFTSLIDATQSVQHDDEMLIFSLQGVSENKENHDLKLLLKIIQRHKELQQRSTLLRIEFLPHISSGEMSYLTMYGRMNDVLTKGLLAEGRDVNNDLLVFLDEAETALHPQWQRELVWNWLWFFETFAKDRSVHLIFASHSPLLLSDIPVSHAIFLERQELKDSNKVETTTIVRSSGQVVKKSLDMRDTFFANIQDLYALPFVLKSGVVGKRAELLLREALNKKLKIEYVDRKKVVERIGDPIVRSVALETLRLGGYEDLNNEEK